MSSRYVMDASAILVLLNGEPGEEIVREALQEGVVVASVNLSEVIGKLTDAGLSPDEVRQVVGALSLDVKDFDSEQAYEAGFLRPRATKADLPLGDRACIALAKTLGLMVLTSDRSWLDLGLPVDIRVVR